MEPIEVEARGPEKKEGHNQALDKIRGFVIVTELASIRNLALYPHVPHVLTDAEERPHPKEKRTVFQVTCLGTSHTDVCGAVGGTEEFSVREEGGIRPSLTQLDKGQGLDLFHGRGDWVERRSTWNGGKRVEGEWIDWWRGARLTWIGSRPPVPRRR